PFDGVIKVTGAVWMNHIGDRSNDWALSLNDVVFSTGAISATDPYTRANPLDFTAGSGGAAALQGIAVAVGDVVKLEFTETSPDDYGWYVGLRLAITTDYCGNGVVSADEQCDDGNAIGGDGCSASCEIETGWTCNGNPSLCTASCGDGLI